MKIFGAQHYRVMPWKNGGGTTTEIYAHRPSADGFDWRVSIADVGGDGPFSRFEGYDRHIMTIEGLGFVLEGGPDGNIDVGRRFEPHRFSGDWPIFCRLRDGRSRDFNLMARRAEFESLLTVSSGAGDDRLSAANGWVFVHILAGSASADLHSMQPADSLLLAPGESIRLQRPGDSTVAAICTITPRS